MTTVADLLNNKTIQSYLLRIVGEEGLDLLAKFPKEGEYSDEELAEKTGINLNSVRHTLYTLYEKRLAEYRRIKNTETGWLTYLWKLKPEGIHDAICDEMRIVLEKLETRKKFEEENDFFVCKTCGTFTFNDVVNTGFVCPSCEKPLEHFDNETLLNALNKRISSIKRSLCYE